MTPSRESQRLCQTRQTSRFHPAVQPGMAQGFGSGAPQTDTVRPQGPAGFVPQVEVEVV